MFNASSAHFPKVSDPDAAQRGIESWTALAAETQDAGLAAFMSDAAEQAPFLLRGVFANSPYLGALLLREPQILRDLMEKGADASLTALSQEVWAEIAEEADIARLMRGLRVFKRRAALLIALADLADLWPLERITGALSQTAETALRLAAQHLLRDAANRGEFALPDPADPEKDSGLIVLAMGKLGAHALNYSSDIDLIIFYDDEKIAYSGRKSLRECMVRITRDLVRIMEERTADGYVFRTDLRLRPDPGSTPAAISLTAAETYYGAFGQNWERAAMIKARPVAGDLAAGQTFLTFLRPFIWRKSLDFAAIQDIHSIKRQINAHRGGAQIAIAGHNIKLGRGGIREIEFFAQTQQLIFGGRQPEIRESRTLPALRTLQESGHISAQALSDMTDSYTYLRRLEHRLQMIDDQQTQTLPADEAGLGRLAAFMGYDGVDAFSSDLRHMLEAVENHYAHLFEDAPSLSGPGNLVFTGGEDDPETLATIKDMGFGNPASVSAQIRGWHHGRLRATRSTRARELLTELTPALLKALSRTANADAAFLRFHEFLSRLPAGIALFSLFHANPSLLDLVADIMGDAPRLADHLARNPNLLDSVLDPGFFAPPPGLQALRGDCEKVVAQARDFQEVLDLSRRWTNDHKFQIGVLTLRNVIDAEASSRALTDIAEAVLSALFPHVEAEFAQAHGHFPGAGIAIIAMGKLGSCEMTPTSDLDLVLVYDVPEGADESDGTKPLAPSVYFSRLTQRLLTAITAKTGEGALYDVDMRLRPSGHSGPIASSLDAFIRYHEKDAWTWEHMAMTRARVIVAPPALGQKIDAVIEATLRRGRDPEQLLLDVADMRSRILRDRKTQSSWDVKNRRGGLIDIEFIAQYLQLRHGGQHPQILAKTTASVLEHCAAQQILPLPDVTALRQALHLWTIVQNVLRQTIEGAFTEDDAPRGLKDLLARATGEPDFQRVKSRMDEAAEQVMAIYRRLIDVPAESLSKTKES